jgi:uncharacterized protein YjiS (DUF1127 family)
MIMSQNLSAPIWAQTPTEQFRGQRLVATLMRLWGAYLHWRIERQAIIRLRSMSDAQLDDIGLVRSETEFGPRADMDAERLRIVSHLSIC